jgi:hypothetical protein
MVPIIKVVRIAAGHIIKVRIAAGHTIKVRIAAGHIAPNVLVTVP